MVSEEAKRLLQEAEVFNSLILAAAEEGTLEIDEKGIRGMIVIKNGSKLTNMNLPRRGVPFYHCPICKHRVPFKDKHNRKRHAK